MGRQCERRVCRVQILYTLGSNRLNSAVSQSVSQSVLPVQAACSVPCLRGRVCPCSIPFCTLP